MESGSRDIGKALAEQLVPCPSPKTTSGRNEDLDCELDGRFGSGFRSGTGCSQTAEHMEDKAKRRKRGRQAHLSSCRSPTSGRTISSGCSGSQIVAMMRTTEPGHRNDPAG